MHFRALCFAASSAAILTLIACSSREGAEVEVPSAGAASCNAPFGWWEGEGLEPLFVDPSGRAPTVDCDFHVWAWSAFVNATQIDPDTKLPLFMSMPTPAQLGTGLKAAPTRLQLVPRMLKHNRENEINQAGPGGVLVDQGGRVVYYSTHMDATYFNFAEQYYGKANYAKAAPTLNFPDKSTVFKASWRIVQPGEDTSKMFTTVVDLAKLANGSEGTVVVTKDFIRDVEVTLVGLHVVGVLKDHPEFAWATFEHDGNAPNLAVGGDPTGSEAVSSKSFAFYAANTPADKCNDQGQSSPPKVVIDEATQVCSTVTNAFRQFEYGDAEPYRQADIESANQNFRAGLVSHAPSNSMLNPVFANYFLVGTVWQDPAVTPLKPGDGNLDATAVGSTSLMNATLETYVQGKGQNCFMCHTTAGNTGAGYPGKNINLSHILIGPFFGD